MDQAVRQEVTAEGVSRAVKVQAVWPEEILEAAYSVAIVAEAPPVVMAGAVLRGVMAATVLPTVTVEEEGQQLAAMKRRQPAPGWIVQRQTGAGSMGEVASLESEVH